MKKSAMKLPNDKDALNGLRIDADEELGNRIGNDPNQQEHQQSIGGIVVIGRDHLDEGVGNENVPDYHGQGDEGIQGLT